MDLAKLEREEEAAIAAMMGNQPDVPTEAPAPTRADQFSDEVQAVVSESVDNKTITPVAPVVKEEDTSSWKHRYTTYKASTDNTIFQLRKDNAQLRVLSGTKDDKISALVNEITTLRSEANQTQDTGYEFSQADKDILGDDAVEIMKRAVDANRTTGADPQVEALKAELASIRSDKREADKKALENLETDSLNNLKAKLTSVVPTWSSIDTEPEFSAYLNEIDIHSGQPRMNFFTSAIHDRDVGRVATFYKAYSSLKPQTREEILASHIGVNGSGASESTTTGSDIQKKVYTLAEYSKFMDDYTKGKYRKKMKEASIIEKQFDKAFEEGRVR